MSGPGDAMLLISIAVFFVLSVIVTTVELVRNRVDFFDPIIIFVFFYSLFVLPLPIRAYMTDVIEGNVTPYLHDIYPYLPSAIFLSAFGLLVVVIVYHSPLVKALAARTPLPPPASLQGSALAFWQLMLVSMSLIALLSYSVGSFGALVFRGYGASAELFGRGYLAIGFPWGFVASLFLLHRYALKPRLGYLLGFGLLFSVLVIIQLVMGNRSLILTSVMSALIFWHLVIRKFRKREVISIAVLTFAGLSIYGFLRSSDYEGIAGFLIKSQENFSQLLQSAQIGRSVFYTLTVGEFVVPFETLPQMIRAVGHEIDPLWGLSFLRAPLYYIPSAIFPERPRPLANWYMEQFYGTGIGLNEGRQFFFLTEGYLNFGVAGILFVAEVWGLFLGLLREYKRRACGDPGALLLYAVTLSFVFRAIAGDFSSLVVALPSQNLIPAFLGVLIATGFRPWRRVRRRVLSPSKEGKV